jgi:ABC-type transporter Mla MlaB component
VVFSFFKKDQKDPKSGSVRSGSGVGGPRPGSGVAAPRPGRLEQKPVGRPISGTINRSLNRPSNAEPLSGGGGFAVTENALPDREIARNLAMATAAKIDAIESEMARDFLRPRRTPAEIAAELPGNAETVEAAAAPLESDDPGPAPIAAPPPNSRRIEAAQSEEDAFDPGSEILGGSIDAIEVNGGSSSALDETAILFANQQDHAAEGGLRNALIAESLGPVTERGWLMLLELLQQRNDRPAYDQLATQFSLRFNAPAPSWINYSDAERVVVSTANTPVVALPESIDAGIVKPLEEFKNLAMTNPALTLDVSATRQVDLVGAELLLRVFNAFKRASHELTVRGAEQLLVALRSSVEAGRRDASDAAWMLLLEVQRLLDRQADFEETGIQYCITYEVSPPSWEPPMPNIRVAGGTAAESAGVRGTDPLTWRGEILGDGEHYLNRLVSATRDSKHVSVECRQLRRVGFTASTSLLGQLIRLQQAGVAVEFRNVNVLIAALWQLLGVATVCEIRIRRA